MIIANVEWWRGGVARLRKKCNREWNLSGVRKKNGKHIEGNTIRRIQQRNTLMEQQQQQKKHVQKHSRAQIYVKTWISTVITVANTILWENYGIYTFYPRFIFGMLNEHLAIAHYSPSITFSLPVLCIFQTIFLVLYSISLIFTRTSRFFNCKPGK